MNYNNKISMIENHKGVSLSLKANNLLELEEILLISLDQIKEQLDYRFNAETKLSTREVLEMNKT